MSYAAHFLCFNEKTVHRPHKEIGCLLSSLASNYMQIFVKFFISYISLNFLLFSYYYHLQHLFAIVFFLTDTLLVSKSAEDKMKKK